MGMRIGKNKFKARTRGLFHLNEIFFFKGTSVFVAACRLSVAACGTSFPDQGSNAGPLHWEHVVLAAGPPGRSWWSPSEGSNLQSSYPCPCPHSSGTSERLPITCCRLPPYCSSAAVSHTQGRCVCRVCPRGCPQLLPPQAVTTPSLPGREQRAGRGCGRRPAPPRLPGASPQMLSQPLAGMLRPLGTGIQTSTGPKTG